MSSVDLNSVILKKGPHRGVQGEYCAVEAAHASRGLEVNDRCAPDESPAMVTLLIRLNDAFPATPEGDVARTEALRPWLPRLADSRGSPALERARAYALADCACRELAALTLHHRGFPLEASIMASLPPITDKASAEDARDAGRQVRDDLRAADAADYAADAADYAADYAADAADYAADYAAAAAYDAAAAYAAAYAAAAAADYAANAADAYVAIRVAGLTRLLEVLWAVKVEGGAS